MATYRPGTNKDTFAQRCLNHDKEIIKCIGDKISINGEQVCVYFDRDFEKYTDGDVGVKTSIIEMCYLACDVSQPLRRGMEITRNGHVFSLRTEPEDHYDGWLCVELKHCGFC